MYRTKILYAFLLLILFSGVGWADNVAGSGTEVHDSRAADLVTSVTVEYQNLATLATPTVAWATMSYFGIDENGSPNAAIADFSIASTSQVWTPAITIVGKSLASIQFIESGTGIATGTISSGTYEIWVSGMIDSASPAADATLTTKYEPYVRIEQQQEDQYGLKVLNLMAYRKMRLVYQQTHSLRTWPKAYINFRKE